MIEATAKSVTLLTSCRKEGGNIWGGVKKWETYNAQGHSEWAK